jgi:hypothetical protein
MDHKDITIGDQQYRIGQMTAADGSWIRLTFVKRYRAYLATITPTEKEDAEKAPSISPEQGFAMTANFLLEQLTREELAEVQRLSLSVCGRYSVKTGTPIAMPVLMSDGRYAIPDLEFDGPTVLQLTQETVAFNIAPFFTAAGSNQTPATVDSSQPSIQA